MTPDRWRQVTEIFHAALAVDEGGRAAFVRLRCGDDSALRRDVESMIAAHGDAGRFGETPAFAVPPLEPGVSFGPYRIERRLDAGGMGDVYKARDTRLGRTVAVKVLAPELARDPEFQSRFEREARIISQLDHPHICALYDVGTEGGTSYLVMPHLDGQTLAQRIARGLMPLDAALTTAVQIADALDCAHSHGVIHRDLKPANIFLTKSGVKLLDFGLAKSKGAVVTGASETRPRDTVATTPGMVLGTVPYMAPEQLEGKEADVRTDLFAMGAVVYEMITGRMAFAGAHQANVMSAIMSADPPPLSAVRADVPASLDRIVAACLAKDPEARWQSARDVKRALTIVEPTPAASTAVPAATRERRMLAVTGAGLVAGALAGVLVWAFATGDSAPPATASSAFRFELSPPEGTVFGLSSSFMAVSPDGRSITFHAGNERGDSQLWVRPLDSLAARVLERAEGGVQQFWSPDGRYLAFVSDFKLRTIDIASGLVQTLADASVQAGAWSRDGAIVFRRRNQSFLSRVSAAGGSPVPATTLDQSHGETQHNWPQFLPDGRHFLYHARSTRAEYDGMTYAASIDSSDRVALLKTDSHAVYVPQGYLLFVRSGTLVAQPFDIGTLRTTGEPVPVADHVQVSPDTLRGAYSVSQTGVLAYRTVGETQLAWFHRTGRELDTVGPPGRYANPAFSPDGKRLAVQRVDPKTNSTDIWVIEVARGVMSRLTADPSPDEMPLWSRDGNRIVFKSRRDGRWGLYQMAANGSGQEELVVPLAAHPGAPLDWSVDGRFLLYEDWEATPGSELFRLPLSRNRTPIRVDRTEFRETQGRLSPDGRWMAYVSNRSGKNEVNISPFTSGTGTWQVSTNGGIEPQWRGDGKELFYLAHDRNLMAVPLTIDATVQAGLPVRLFETQMRATFTNDYRNQYVASADGQRFLLDHRPRGESSSSSVTVVVNWMAALTNQ